MIYCPLHSFDSDFEMETKRNGKQTKNIFWIFSFNDKTNRRNWNNLCLFCLGPKNYEGLLLRSEVLYRLSHFRSSLADAENAIKCRPTVHKVSSCAWVHSSIYVFAVLTMFSYHHTIIHSHIYSMPKPWLQWAMLRMQLSHTAFVFTLIEIYRRSQSTTN